MLLLNWGLRVDGFEFAMQFLQLVGPQNDIGLEAQFILQISTCEVYIYIYRYTSICEVNEVRK